MNKTLSRTVVLLCCTSMIAGCAGMGPTGAAYRPLVDTQGVDMNKFERDLQDCQGFAQQTASAGQSAVAGAVAGAALGARGRVLLRPSGTEPVVRVMVESDQESLSRRCAESIAEAIGSAG